MIINIIKIISILLIPSLIAEEISLRDTSSYQPFIFDEQLEEAKIILSEAIISDLNRDTLASKYQFEQLIDAISSLEATSKEDEFTQIELNKLMIATTSYIENKSISFNKSEIDFTLSLVKDRMNEYIYSQKLEELEDFNEKVEIIPGHVPITYNKKVASIIKYYQNQGRNSFQKWLNRMNKYKLIILPILEKENMPPELFYLAMIESGLNPNAYSYAHASGVWQFIKSTGKIYGLNKDWFVDERRDFEKSTIAACRYLKDLYKEFDDWYLAFAAYNCGSRRVNKEIRRYNTRDYWKLIRLPAQTRNYIPNIMAAIYISNNPKKYGFEINSEPNMSWDVIKIDKSVSLDVISECSGVDVEVIKSYNPELKQGIIPRLDIEKSYINKDKTYSLRMPKNINPKFHELLAKVEVQEIQEIRYEKHRVRNGENLTLIAKKYDSKIKDIVALNNLKNANQIKPGQTLDIPIGNIIATSKTSKESRKPKKVYHKVRYGDTLSGLAKKYKTHVRKIKRWNNLTNDQIKRGQRLKIWIKT